MKITILGCGGSFGSPLAWNRNGNIDVTNKRNFRTRSSILVEDNKNCILIDKSPDLRQQLYDNQCTNIDAVLYSRTFRPYFRFARHASYVINQSKLYPHICLKI